MRLWFIGAMAVVLGTMAAAQTGGGGEIGRAHV